MRSFAAGLLCVLAVTGVGCGRDDGTPEAPLRTLPRTLAVWAGPSGVDQVTVAELERVGVDEIVVPRGSIELTGGVPVLRTRPVPQVAEGIPIAVSFLLNIPGRAVDPKAADALWTALSGELGSGAPPRELLLELPNLPEKVDVLVQRLARLSGLPIVPVLGTDQAGDPGAPSLVRATGSCVLVAYGQVERWRKGAAAVTGSYADTAAPLAAAGVPVRAGIVIVPSTDPPLEGWGEALAPLTEPENARIGDDPIHQRRFTFEKAMEWSGRTWQAGQHVSISWIDAAGIDAAIGESSRTTLPPCGGWDIIWLPPATGASLGIGLEGLVAYLDGKGPGPFPVVRLERSGSSARIVVENRSPFPSAVSRYGNWFELDGGGTALVAEDRGGFDGVTLGSRRDGRFRRGTSGVADAVRFTENELAPGETIRSGRVRLTSRKTSLTLRWQVQLSDGRVVTGSETLARH